MISRMHFVHFMCLCVKVYPIPVRWYSNTHAESASSCAKTGLFPFPAQNHLFCFSARIFFGCFLQLLLFFLEQIKHVYEWQACVYGILSSLFIRVIAHDDVIRDIDIPGVSPVSRHISRVCATVFAFKNATTYENRLCVEGERPKRKCRTASCSACMSMTGCAACVLKCLA